jgi:aspartyl-tRNA(Asn)/glutamyl-tRNA(Gln) amidotransferase subunit C
VPIDSAEVRRIAGLARLELDEADIEPLRRQLQSVLDHVLRLEELDAEPSIARVRTTDGRQPLREDDARPSFSAGEALRNAPEQAAGHFRVPRILGG